jgi:hypothetical protein
MATGLDVATTALGAGSGFPTTHWSRVLCAGHDEAPASAAALEALCRAYWPPLYAFVRRNGYAPADAQDLVQGFLAHLLARNDLAAVAPQKGRFRSFLLTALKHFLVSEARSRHALKRGGGQQTIFLAGLPLLGLASDWGRLFYWGSDPGGGKGRHYIGREFSALGAG